MPSPFSSLYCCPIVLHFSQFSSRTGSLVLAQQTLQREGTGRAGTVMERRHCSRQSPCNFSQILWRTLRGLVSSPVKVDKLLCKRTHVFVHACMCMHTGAHQSHSELQEDEQSELKQGWWVLVPSQIVSSKTHLLPCRWFPSLKSHNVGILTLCNQGQTVMGHDRSGWVAFPHLGLLWTCHSS
jgi:hypothetical protein